MTDQQPPGLSQPTVLTLTSFKWERRLQQIVIAVARMGLGVLFLTELAWKIPRIVWA